MSGRGRGGKSNRAAVQNLKLAQDMGMDVSQVVSLQQSLEEKPVGLCPDLYPDRDFDERPVKIARVETTMEENFMLQKHQALIERFKQSIHHLPREAPQSDIERYSDAYAIAPSSLAGTLKRALSANIFPAELTRGIIQAADREAATASVGQFSGAFLAGGMVRTRSLSGTFGRLEEREQQQLPRETSGSTDKRPPEMMRRNSVDSQDDADGDGDYGKDYYNSDEDEGTGADEGGVF